MTYKFIVPETLNNLNDYTTANRRNKYVGGKMKNDNEIIITAAILEQIRTVRITKPVKISYTWIEPNRKRDLDNIAFAKKFVQDALVKNGILENDGWKNITGFEDHFQVDKNNPRIEILITEIDD